MSPRNSCCILSCLVIASIGCTFNRAGTSPAPITFHAPPTLPQIIEAVNANSSRVRQLHSDDVRLSIPGLPVGMRATLDFERAANPRSPGRFRLAGEVLGARQLDLGSNDREYWMWVKQNQPPTVFWGRHEEFHRSAAQSILPMPPSWIAEAMGIVWIDPNGFHEGPYGSSTNGLLQVRSRIPSARGDLLRVLEIDQQRALIVQQQIYDAANRLLAVADTGDFFYDALNDVSLPRSIKIKLPPANLSFDLDVGRYSINIPAADPSSVWAMPRLDGHQYRDLANPQDMQGVNLMGGNDDFYDDRSLVSEPVRPEIPRSAWRRLPVAFSVFR